MVSVNSNRKTKEVKYETHDEIWTEEVVSEIYFLGIRVYKNTSFYEATDCSDLIKMKKNPVGFKKI